MEQGSCQRKFKEKSNKNGLQHVKDAGGLSGKGGMMSGKFTGRKQIQHSIQSRPHQ